MISAVPNQPIALNDTRLQGCYTSGPTRCLLALPTDVLQVQIEGAQCDTAEGKLSNPNFESTTGWAGTGQFGSWVIEGGRACHDAAFQTALVDTTFSPVVGNPYVIEFVIESLVGSIFLSFAGLTETITSPGTYTFSTVAVSSFPLAFIPINITNEDGIVTNPAEVCLSYAQVYDANTDLTVSLVEDGSVAYSFTYAGAPENFAFDRDRVNISVPLEELGVDDGCYILRVEDGCDEVTLESQCISVADHTCTLELSGCNNNDAGGLYFPGFTPSMRARAELVRPSFEYEVSEERLSNGRINRYYADRQRVMELRVDPLDEFGHDFLSALVLYDHFYIGQTEYVIDADDYQPAYGDVWDDQGGVVLKVRPKQELARKVLLGPDDVACSPPPNYWVQGSGPNEDYILQEQNGDRIRLHA